MVTVNGRPLTIFNDSGFMKILRPLTEAISKGFTINSHNIKNHILNASNVIISSIKNDIKKQLISLKIDSVKRHNRSILGINIQYIKNGEITLKTLAMVEIFDQHTAENLKQSLLDILLKYEITREQIFTITCDNAANMIKMARIISVNDTGNDNFDPNFEVYDNTDYNNDDDDNQIDSDNEYMNDGIPISNEDIENELLIESFNIDEANMAIESFEDNVFDAISPSPISSCVRCAVHTLQLCILDGFKNTPITSCLVQARKVDALEPVKIATLALQKQEITLGDFYGIWLKASNGLNTNGSILAKNILKSMKTREILLLKNPVFLAAIFLDPRYQCMLNENAKISCIDHLVKTWKMMIQIQDDGCQTDDANNSTQANINAESSKQSTEITDDPDGFELFTISQSSLSQSSSSSHCDTGILNDISVSLHNFKEVNRLHYTTNILEFWETQKYDKPDLYKLAKIVLAVPATQVSVERNFSGIKFILSDLRTSLSANLLDAIMIVRSNTKFM